jgi:Predicted acyl-CoA transferases/carnitine dehydratase
VFYSIFWRRQHLLIRTQDDFPKTHSPSLGEHNREILTKLGVDEELIMKMEEREKMNADMLKQMAELAAQ